MTQDHGVHSTVLRLTESLRSYIEAQYHVRHESLIGERRRLLEESEAVSHAQRATASLIALATMARRQRDGRVLLPTRLHMFFRGLPALFACVDPTCTHDPGRAEFESGRIDAIGLCAKQELSE